MRGPDSLTLELRKQVSISTQRNLPSTSSEKELGQLSYQDTFLFPEKVSSQVFVLLKAYRWHGQSVF